jgi:hypothetical protein
MPRLSIILGAFAIVLSGCATQAQSFGPGTTAAAPPGTATNASAAPTASPSSVPVVGTWSATGSMIAARAGHTATKLPNGRILVAGGAPQPDDTSAIASAEIYDPTTGTWSATGGMVTPRVSHTATLLRNGTVLVAGGFCPGSYIKGCPTLGDPDGAIDPSGAISLAEIYDPSTGKWTATGSMTTPRSHHTATLLADGRVLVAGAEHGMPDAILDSVELYDPDTGTWSATGSMITARWQQFAVLLPDGKVLTVGGIGPVSPTVHDVLAAAEVYDPSTGRWTATGGLITARAQGGTATLLGDGKVIVAGGDGPGEPMLATAELYDPNRGTWTATAAMSGPRVESSSTLLADGRVFVVGGFSVPGDPDGLLASAELFDPRTASWIGAGSMSIRGFDLTTTLLADGRVLVAGGLVIDGVSSSAELYDPAPGP